MAKSKRDKTRIKNLNNFKESKKKPKMQELPKFKPFRQVPHWEPDTKFEITAQEFETLKDFFNIFSEPIAVMQDIFNRSLQKGDIKIKYIDNENKEIPQEEVQQYIMEMRKMFAEEQTKVSPETEIQSDSISESNESEQTNIIVEN